MNVLVDTSVWSPALRRKQKASSPLLAELELRELIKESRACLIDAVRQELLSGIREQERFERLRETLRFFPVLETGIQEHELGAEFFNRCRRHGIQGSNTDFLICAVAQTRKIPILTVDKDFEHFAKYCSIRLHSPRSGLHQA